MAKKVICNHQGGVECTDCRHNQRHEPVTYRTGPKCTEYGILCQCAINGGEGTPVVCVEEL